MSTRLKIPSDQKPQFKKILELTDEQTKDLYAALETTPPAADFRVFLDDLSSRIRSLEEDEVYRIVAVLFAIYRFRDSAENRSDDVPDELARAYATSEDISEADQLKLASRLTQFLNHKSSLGLSAKATEILLQNSCSFTKARIITDVRPIFSGQEPSSPGGAVIIHMLKIEFLESSQPKEFFVALSTQDIKELKDVLERAGAKERSINALLQSSGLPVFGVASV